jgi:hypothetical protein
VGISVDSSQVLDGRSAAALIEPHRFVTGRHPGPGMAKRCGEFLQVLQQLTTDTQLPVPAATTMPTMQGIRPARSATLTSSSTRPSPTAPPAVPATSVRRPVNDDERAEFPRFQERPINLPHGPDALMLPEAWPARGDRAPTQHVRRSRDGTWACWLALPVTCLRNARARCTSMRQ